MPGQIQFNSTPKESEFRNIGRRFSTAPQIYSGFGLREIPLDFFQKPGKLISKQKVTHERRPD